MIRAAGWRRVVSFALYLGFLLAAVVFLPLVLAGPRLVALILPDRLSIIGDLYWPVVLLGSVCMLATLYHLAVPLRTRWRADLPGAALTLLIWLGGSALLRLVLGLSVGTTSIYGPLAAPIAVLVWLYLLSVAILIGAAFNASLDAVFPRLSGIDHQRRDIVAAATTAPPPPRIPRPRPRPRRRPASQ